MKLGSPTAQQINFLKWLKPYFEDGVSAVIIDLETTGLSKNDEAVEIGIVTLNGEVLFDEQVKPITPVHPEAERVHGLSIEALADKPTIVDHYDALKEILSNHHLMAYNLNFDWRLLTQSFKKHDLAIVEPPDRHCVMLRYAAYYGAANWTRGKRRSGYKSQSLDNAVKQQGIQWENRDRHSAIEDCIMTARLLETIWEHNHVHAIG